MTDPYRRAATNIRKQRQQREQDIARNVEAVADVYTVTGRFMVDGSGEAVVPLNFPVNFIQVPNFSFGSELAPGESVEDDVTSGAFPIVSCFVLSWNTTADDGEIEAAQIFTGCRLGVRVNSVVSRKMWIHWRIEGLAVANPIFNAQTAGGYA